jgi:hypothetical protein
MVQLSAAIGDLRGEVTSLRSELRARPATPAAAASPKPPVGDKHAIVGRIEQHDSSPVTVSADLSPHVEIPNVAQMKRLVAIIAGRHPRFAAVDLMKFGARSLQWGISIVCRQVSLI